MAEQKAMPTFNAFAMIILLVGLLGTLQSLSMALSIILNPSSAPTGSSTGYLIITNISATLLSGLMLVCGVGLLGNKPWAPLLLLRTIIIQNAAFLISIAYAYLVHQPITPLLIAFSIGVVLYGIIVFYLWKKFLKKRDAHSPAH